MIARFTGLFAFKACLAACRRFASNQSGRIRRLLHAN